jgi:hypothetical protein
MSRLRSAWLHGNLGQNTRRAQIIQENFYMSAIRMLFIFMAAFISLGIWLTGVNQVHWLLYIPPVALLFAGVTGICPGYVIFRKLGFRGEITGGKL